MIAENVVSGECAPTQRHGRIHTDTQRHRHTCRQAHATVGADGRKCLRFSSPGESRSIFKLCSAISRATHQWHRNLATQIKHMVGGRLGGMGWVSHPKYWLGCVSLNRPSSLLPMHSLCIPRRAVPALTISEPVHRRGKQL